MKSKALDFIYKETTIHFLLKNEGDVMVNATEMAKIFGKEPKDFLRLNNVKNYIEALLKKNIVADSTQNEQKNVKNEPKNNYIVADVPRYNMDNIYYSSNKAGTFMNRKLALKFAAWLDVEFELWVQDTIESILFSEYYMLHRQKTIEIEETKKIVNELEFKILNKIGDIDTAIELIKQQKHLKSLYQEKTKAIQNQVKVIQYELFSE
jgi:hypothetical protein